MQSSATDPPPLNGSILEDGSGHEARGAMVRKRHKPKLRRVEVLRGQGRTMAPDRRFRADLLQLGGMSRDRLRQWKDLQKKDRLRKAVADPTLEADPDGDSTRRLFSPSPCRACIDQVRPSRVQRSASRAARWHSTAPRSVASPAARTTKTSLRGLATTEINTPCKYLYKNRISSSCRAFKCGWHFPVQRRPAARKSSRSRFHSMSS